MTKELERIWDFVVQNDA